LTGKDKPNRRSFMSIKILIERKFKNAVAPEMLQVLDEIRIKALRNRGYIGGETVVNVDDNREVIVISAWSSVEDWKTWYGTKEWKELEKKLSPQLQEPAKIRSFMPAADYLKTVSAKPGDKSK
jgi:heme-degrading monooxygenase HmoA